MAKRNPWLAKDEIKAAKRWLKEQAAHYDLEGAIVLGDDLYAHQPWCEAVLEQKMNPWFPRMNFILVCKPESHKTLYEFLALYPPEELELKLEWSLYRTLSLPLC
jgi:hypothetical protein